MPSKPNLNDLQLVLLATAIQRDDGSILPPPENLSDRPERLQKAITALLRRQLILEVPVTDRSTAWREEDQQPIGLAITSAGRTIIGAGNSEKQAPTDAPAAAAPSDSTLAGPHSNSPRAGSKIETVIGMLRSKGGATLAELVEATGWLPHTARAALTGIRKKGHAITKSRRADVTVYQIAKA
jgi:hypothetical protein